MSFHELQGFLFAVASAPELIQPSEWLPLISREQAIGFADAREAESILGLVVALYNEINLAVLQRSDAMPSGCRFLEDTNANMEPQAPVSQWSRGFIHGSSWLSELWEPYVADDGSELSEEFAACTMTLSFFVSRPVAESFFRESNPRKRRIDPKAFAEYAATMRRLFPSALASYAHIGRTIAEVLSSDD